MDKKTRRLKNQIINNLLKLMLVNLSDKYLLKLKSDKKNPPKMIAEYLDYSIYLLDKGLDVRVETKNILAMDDNQKAVFNLTMSQFKEYAPLCHEMNVIFNIISSPEIQNKVFNYFYESFLDFKNAEIALKKQKAQLNVNQKVTKLVPKKANFYYMRGSIINLNR